MLQKGSIVSNTERRRGGSFIVDFFTNILRFYLAIKKSKVYLRGRFQSLKKSSVLVRRPSSALHYIEVSFTLRLHCDSDNTVL